jgi:PadR family transcriptional regulator, regulatory protein PadR
VMQDPPDLLRRPALPDEPDSDAPAGGTEDAVPAGSGTLPPGLGIASTRDAAGIPVHRGWSPTASHHRWLEPFVLMALAGGSSHGYAIVGILTEVGINQGAVDVGQVYRTLRDLEQAGQVVSSWTTGTGAARRDYTITDDGSRALDEWAAVMKERQRLIAEFDAAYLGWVSERRRSRMPG